MRSSAFVGMSLAEILILVIFSLLLLLIHTMDNLKEKQLDINKRNLQISELKESIKESQSEEELYPMREYAEETLIDEAREPPEIESGSTENGENIKKGKAPSCLYEDEENEKGSVYLFHIGTFEDYFIVKQRDIQKIQDPELRGRFRGIYEKLPTADILFEQPLRSGDFLEQTEDIYKMAKNKLIKDYECVFFVAFYDRIPSTSKDRYKNAIQIIGAHFYLDERNSEIWDTL